MSVPAILKPRIVADMKSAMRAGEKQRLGIIRLILSSIKQLEVDARVELDDNQILAVLDKMSKQRRESLDQFAKAGREDLVAQELFELEVIKEYLPIPLTGDEIESLIESTMNETGATSMKDMGKVMSQLKPQLQGRADMRVISDKIKARLS